MKKIGLIVTGLIVGFQLVTAGCGKKMTEEQYFTQAQQLEQNENFAKAADIYLSLYKRYPSGTRGDEALFRAAIIQSNQLKQFPLAIESHRRLLRAFPKSKYAAQSLFMIGFVYANDLKDLNKARETYAEFLTKYPTNELASSVRWELDNLGKDINSINFLAGAKSDSTRSK